MKEMKYSVADFYYLSMKGDGWICRLCGKTESSFNAGHRQHLMITHNVKEVKSIRSWTPSILIKQRVIR